MKRIYTSLKIRSLKAVLDCIVGIVMSVGIVADAE